MIGEKSFRGAGIEEMTLPRVLKEVQCGAFRKCDNLKTTYVADGCEADLSNFVPNVIKIVPLSDAISRGLCVSDLQAQKSVVIPEGTEKIGSRLFWGSGVESVEIPASVREIGTEAFCNCRKLSRVVLTGAGIEKDHDANASTSVH